MNPSRFSQFVNMTNIGSPNYSMGSAYSGVQGYYLSQYKKAETNCAKLDQYIASINADLADIAQREFKPIENEFNPGVTVNMNGNKLQAYRNATIDARKFAKSFLTSLKSTFTSRKNATCAVPAPSTNGGSATQNGASIFGAGSALGNIMSPVPVSGANSAATATIADSSTSGLGSLMGGPMGGDQPAASDSPSAGGNSAKNWLQKYKKYWWIPALLIAGGIGYAVSKKND